jgi:hypothetical protein
MENFVDTPNKLVPSLSQMDESVILFNEALGKLSFVVKFGDIERITEPFLFADLFYNIIMKEKVILPFARMEQLLNHTLFYVRIIHGIG